MADVLVVFGSIIIILFLIYGIASIINDCVSSYLNKKQKKHTKTEQFVGVPRIIKKSHSDLTVQAFVGTDVNEYLKKNYPLDGRISLHNIHTEITDLAETDFKTLGSKIYSEVDNGMLSKYGELFTPEDAVKNFMESYKKVVVYFEAEKTEE